MNTSPEKKPLKAESFEAEPMPPKSEQKRGPINLFVQNLNLIAGPLKELIDPIHKVCYEPFQLHWQERYQKQYPGHKAKWVIALDLFLLFAAGALAVGGIFAYLVLPIFPTGQVVSLELLAPKRLVSGEMTKIVLAYRNDSSDTLTNTQLRLTLPDSFHDEDEKDETAITPTTPTENIREWSLGNVPPHGQGIIVVPGVFFAPVSTSQTITAEMTHWVSGETKIGRTAAFYEWPIEDAVLQIGLRTPQQIMRGQADVLTINYANTGTAAVETVIKVQPPDDFAITGARPIASGNEWRLGTLAPGARGTIDVYGYLGTSGADEAPNFTVQAFAVVDGKRQLVQELKQDLLALATGFEFHQEVTEPTGADGLRPGDEFAVTVNYRNNGQNDLRDLVIRPIVEPANLVEGNFDVWSAAVDSSLKLIVPDGYGQRVFRFRLKDNIPPPPPGQPPQIIVTATAEYRLFDTTAKPIRTEAEIRALPIATTLGVKTFALYYTTDGEQLGSGPLPPRVGQTTKYWLMLIATSTTGDVRDARLEATLAPGVEWTGRYSVTAGQPLAHIPASGRVIWQIGDVPSGANGSGTRVAVSFEVSLKPTAGLVGQEPLLLKDIRLAGTDVATNLTLEATGAELTTRLKSDTKASGKAAVMK